MLEGVAYCRMLFDEAGQPADWIYLEVNPAFEALTGLRDASGKRITQLIPGVRETNPELFEIFGRVAETGVPEQFETYLPALERWFSVKVYRPQAGHVAAVFENITEHKRLDEALRDSEQHYRDVVDSLAEGVVVQDAEGRIVASNPAARAILGLEVDEITGKTSFDPEWQSTWSDGTPARGEDHPSTIARTTGRPVRDVVMGVCHPSGIAKRLRVSATPLREGSGDEVSGVVVSFSDISEALRAEEHLAQMEGRYRGLLEAAPDAMVVVNGAGDIVLLNLQAERQFGYNRDELVGQQVTIIIPEGFAERLVADDLRSAADALAQKIGTGIELLARRKDGSEFPIEIMLSPLESAQGILVTAAIRDISVRKAADEELRVAHERLKLFFDANIIGTLIVRQTGAIIEANDYFLDLIGHTRDEFERGEIDWRAITPPEWLSASDHAIGEMRARGTYDPYEKEYLRADGTRVPVLVASTALQGPDESIAAFVLDNTERKRAEAEVLTLNVELEDRVVARTAALDAANGELEAFSYSVSHDLRAPLRSIDAFSQILLREHAEGLDPEARRVLGVVVRNAQQMGHLIDDLLALSRVGRKDLERRPVDMGLLARSVADECSAASPGRAIEFDIGPLYGAPGDPGLLGQVWANLIGNAVKFTRPMEPSRIEVRCRRRDGERRYTVRDNGVGFDPAYADKLFQPFQRLHLTSEFEGTGIGLAIVARIVHRHGGRVWAESAPGEGATFGFSLPTKELT
jgi:PAS domain S-box-containing protein